MTRLLVLTAIDLEARSLARHLGLAPVAAGDWPHFRGGRLEIVPVGMGAPFLDRRVTVTPGTTVIVAGACGGLAPELAAGALIVPEVVVDAAGRRFATDALPPLEPAGTLLTVGGIVATPGDKARLWMETGALAVDMESALVIAWARDRGLPAAAVRGVSDIATAAVPADLAAAVDAGGRLRAGQALRAALARPRAVAEALTLKRGTEAALKNVAAALARVVRA